MQERGELGGSEGRRWRVGDEDGGESEREVQLLQCGAEDLPLLLVPSTVEQRMLDGVNGGHRGRSG